MKTKPSPSLEPGGLTTHPRTQAGMALVIVLGFLVLITGLVLAFFSSVTNESATTKVYSDSASSKLLADSALNIVMGQIAKATKGQSSAGYQMTWASQPGMIRTYSDQGTAEDCFKLYSSSKMVVTGSAVQAALAADVPANWNTQPAIYTDLNAPVSDPSGQINFPIIEGTKLGLLAVAGTNVLTYTTGTTPDIEGFSVLPAAVPNYVAGTAATAANNPVPMPVQWLYVLRDGTVIGADSGGNGVTATFSSAAAKPSTTNPIVSRIAFWTDDETCKLNINTASEGTYYAMPHTNTKIDMKTTASFTTAPPLTGEYTRYPGHPATTCLSVALGKWLGNPAANASATYGYGSYFSPNAYTSATDNSNYLGYTTAQPPTDPALSGTGLAAYMLLSPRNAIGGSLAGTVNFSTATSTSPVRDSDRLYASVDELIFRCPQAADANPRTDFPNAGLTRAVLEKQKFFLTASSRAPELTPFNTPKVSLWPQWLSAANRLKYQAPSQQLLAFCSSFGAPGVNPTTPSTKFEYFWEWYSAAVAPTNANQYSSTSSCSSTQDWTVARNQQLAKYLCNLGNTKVPGYGASFRSASKYSDRCFSNIVLESLDYIRSSVARADYQSPATKTNGTITTADTSELSAEYIWVAPLMVDDSVLPGVSATAPIKGFGYFPVLSEVVLGEGLDPTPTPDVRTPFLAFESFTAPWAFPAGQQQLYVTINNLANLGIVKTDGSAPPAVIQNIRVDRRVPILGKYAGTYGRNLPIHTYIANLSGYKFANSDLTSVTMGGTQPVQIAFLDGFKRTFQTLNLNFPSIKVNSVPTIGSWMSGDWANNVWYSEVLQLFRANASVARGLECDATTVAAGDYRILGGTVNAASEATPPAGTVGNLFAQNPSYNSQDMQAHSLWVYCRNSAQPISTGTSGALNPTSTIAGTLAPLVNGAPVLTNVDYGDVAVPFAPPGMQGARNIYGKSGDWDTGAGVFPDGPYLNVVDQVDGNDYGAGGGGSFGIYFPSIAAFRGFSQTFSPNKRIASPVQLGSLPTGVSASPPRPWETLLFCPNPAARTVAIGTDTKTETGHIGFQNPPDHLFLENFTIPVVEPYAISEPLSTAGKVNLNFQIAPFTYIERSTALRGVLKSTLMTGISGYDVKEKTYKGDAVSPDEVRYDINRDATLAGISKYYFNQGKLFMYASEICDVFLVPQAIPGAVYNIKAIPPPTSYDSMLAWWNPTTTTADPLATMCMTGDNLREEPYSRLYPRLTTKSNTFTVHCRVQTLQKRVNTNASVWIEGKDVVSSEYRGSSIIERYIDPADPQLNSAWDSDTIGVNLSAKADLSRLYKFRVISTKKFAP